MVTLKKIFPDFIGKNPAIVFNNVVLPDPFRPFMIIISLILLKKINFLLLQNYPLKQQFDLILEKFLNDFYS